MRSRYASDDVPHEDCYLYAKKAVNTLELSVATFGDQTRLMKYCSACLHKLDEKTSNIISLPRVQQQVMDAWRQGLVFVQTMAKERQAAQASITSAETTTTADETPDLSTDMTTESASDQAAVTFFNRFYDFKDIQALRSFAQTKASTFQKDLAESVAIDRPSKTIIYHLCEVIVQLSKKTEFSNMIGQQDIVPKVAYEKHVSPDHATFKALKSLWNATNKFDDPPLLCQHSACFMDANENSATEQDDSETSASEQFGVAWSLGLKYVLKLIKEHDGGCSEEN